MKVYKLFEYMIKNFDIKIMKDKSIAWPKTDSVDDDFLMQEIKVKKINENKK